MAKNARNSAVILDSIRSRLEELVAAPTPKPPLEALARVHALLLYIIILVFDGDIRARAAAEAATEALESAADGLIPLFGQNPLIGPSAPRPPEKLPLYPIGPARDFWHTWVLQESVRRTYMITFFVVKLYELLRGEMPRSCGQWPDLRHFWTVSAHLWRAADAFEFAVAWRDRRHFVVNNYK